MRGIVVFLTIAFAGTWPYLFVARLVLGWSLVNPLVQLPVAFMPAIAACVVRRWVTREGFTDAGLRPRLRQAWRFWIIAWLAPLVTTGLILLFATASGWWNPSLPWGGIAFLTVVQIVLTPAYLGEEFGWTTFLWPRITPARPRLAVAATGLIWAVWHYPLAYLGYAEFDDHTVTMALWTLMFMLFEVLLCWLYARTGSVWITSLAHSGNNVVMGLLTEQLLTSGGELSPLQNLICTDAALTLVCVPLLWSKVFARPTRAHGAGI